MGILLTIVYIVVCLVLVAVILLQQDKSGGGGMGAAFGGSSQTVFGSRSGDVLSKTTGWLAVGFMVLAILLAFVSTQQTPVSKELGDQEVPSQPAP